jgi:Flp pilus assembly protein TadG
MPSHAGRRAPDRGAAAVEAALVLPLLLMIVFGIIDIGRMVNAQITVTEAAREGARALALGTDVESRVEQMMGSRKDVTIDRDGCANSPDAVVKVTYQFSFITPLGVLAGGGLSGNVAISARGVMPCYG